MNNYGACEGTGTIDNPIRDRAMSSFADDTAAALKEANMILDALYNNLFGQDPEKRAEAPTPPISCMKDAMVANSEQARILTKRLAELNTRMFG